MTTPRDTLFKYAEDILNGAGFTRLPFAMGQVMARANPVVYEQVCAHIGKIDEEIRELVLAAIKAVTELEGLIPDSVREMRGELQAKDAEIAELKERLHRLRHHGRENY